MEKANLLRAALFLDYENANVTDSYAPLINKLYNDGYNPYIRKIISSKIPEMDDFENILKANELELIISNKPLKKGSSQTIKKKNLNNADFRVYIEVLKVLYNEEIDTFIIYSSDDDYTELICAIKREGKHVIGVGSKNTTSPKYIALFNSFIFIEDLLPSKQNKTEKSTSKEVKKEEKKETKKAKNKAKKEVVEEKKEVKSKVKVEEEKEKYKKDTIFYATLKDSTKEILNAFKGNLEKYLIANIVSDLKENYPYLKEFRRISIEDFKKAGFEIGYADNKKNKCYIKLPISSK